MRRIGCIVSLVIALLIVGVAVWLVSGVLGEPRALSSADPRLAALAAVAPPDASVLVTIDAGPFWNSLRADETVGAIVRENSGADLDLAALLLGRSPAAVWRADEEVGFAASPGPVRSALIQTIARWSDSIPRLERRGDLLVSGSAGEGRQRAYIPPVEGTAILIHGPAESGWPPGMDAVATAITRNAAGQLVLRTVGPPTPAARRPVNFPFQIPVEAPLTVMFWEAVPAVRQLEKILPINLASLSEDGVGLVVFGVDSGGLIPTLEGVVLLPATDQSRQAVSGLFNTALFPQELGLLAGEVTTRQSGTTRVDRIERLGTTIEAATLGGTLVVSLDGRSMDRYLAAPKVAQPPSAVTSWKLVSDLDRLSPLLSAIEDDRALRLVARDFQRSVRQFHRNVRRLRGASAVEVERRNEPDRAVVDLTVTSR